MIDNETFDRNLTQFAARLIEQLAKFGFMPIVTILDHVCYRVETLEAYELWKERLACRAVLLSEAFINGRPIASFKLNTPIRLTAHFSVDVIELPAPKPGRVYPEGFEHAEVVTRCPLEIVLKDFSGLPFDLGNLGADINRDIGLMLESGLVKFHEKSLEAVIEDERRVIAARTSRWAVAVDFDDTLVHSRVQFLAATYQALCTYFEETIDYQTYLERARPTFPEFFANFGVTSPAEIQKVIHLFQVQWQKQNHSLQMFTGMGTALSCLHSEGAEILIWTARDLVTTVDFVRNSALSTIVHSVFAYEPTVSKPEPSSLLSEFCSGARVVMTGDSMSDKLGARNLQAKFFQAAWIQHADLQSEASEVCSSPMEFLSGALTHFRG